MLITAMNYNANSGHAFSENIAQLPTGCLNRIYKSFNIEISTSIVMGASPASHDFHQLHLNTVSVFFKFHIVLGSRNNMLTSQSSYEKILAEAD